MKSSLNDEKEPTNGTNDFEYTIWCIFDGKAGHEAQTRGLLAALQKRISVSSFEIPAPSRRRSLIACILKRFPAGDPLPKPHLIIGAGNRTHLALLAASRCFGGKTIVLMQPTLPSSLFSLCLIPKHDLRREENNILLTDGVLNTVQPATNADPKRGLFLIGGPSAHYDWNTSRLLEQVTTIVNENSEIHWTLTTSRRTPSECTQKLIDLSYSNLEVIPVQKTPKGWVASMLQKCGVVWVSEDSVSMVYEALTASAFTGLLNVPASKSESRVHTSVRHLLEQQRVVYFTEREKLFKSSHNNRLAEADRCADYIVTHLLHAKNATRKKIRQASPIRKIEYWLGRILVTCLHYVPLPVAFYSGHFIGWCASLFPTKRRKIVTENLATIDNYIAKQSLDSNLKQQTHKVFQRTGANIACSFRFARIPPKQIKKYIEVDGLEHLKTAFSLKKGVLILLAHMGPWEVLPYLSQFLDETLRTGAMYRPMNNNYFENWFKSVREQRGTRLFSRADGFHKPVDFLRSGGVLGVLADQKMRQGVIAPFFGKNVPTNPLPGLFQRRSGATTLGLSIKTTAPLKWTIKIFPVTYPEEKENRTREIEATISNRAIEKILLESPLDGFWFSERFYVKN